MLECQSVCQSVSIRQWQLLLCGIVCLYTIDLLTHKDSRRVSVGLHLSVCTHSVHSLYIHFTSSGDCLQPSTVYPCNCSPPLFTPPVTSAPSSCQPTIAQRTRSPDGIPQAVKHGRSQTLGQCYQGFLFHKTAEEEPSSNLRTMEA